MTASRARTPLPDSEENGALDFNFQSIDELLKSKLESLQSFLNAQESNNELQVNSTAAADHKQKSADHINKMRIQSGSAGINDIIHSLTMSRTEVSSQSRELLLAQLYNLIISKPLSVYNESNIGTDKYVTEDKVMELSKIFTSGDYRSPSEFLLLYRSLVALILSDIDEFGGLISPEFCSYIERAINDPPNSVITNENKSNLISGYAALLLILHNGSSGFGMEEKINWLIEASEGFCSSVVTLTKQIDSGDIDYSTVFEENSDKRIINEAMNEVKSEADVAVAGLHATGCLITLLKRGEYLNDFLSDLMPKLVEILDNDVNVEISKAAGRVISLCYELYTYEDNEDDEEDESFNYNAPYYEQESLFSSIERLANISTKKLSKKDKKEVHSIFRDILNTLKNYTDKDKREEIYKRSPEGMELINTAMDSIYIKLSKSRSLPINSWFLYLRLIHLKWCFSYGVHNQLVSSNEIKDILKEPLTEYQLKYGSRNVFDNDDDTSPMFSNLNKFAIDDKKKTELIRKARMKKLTDEIDDLELDS